MIQNGKASNTGKCQRCGGTTRVKCPTCNAQGQASCELCEGEKIVPIEWTPNDNPWLNKRPDLIRLKDGRALLGKVASRSGTKYTIKWRDGKILLAVVLYLLAFT